MGLALQAVEDAKLYEQVARRLAEAIEHGTLQPGDRLPSVRRLAAQERVSVSTVLLAYQHLEDVGVIETRPQSGHYVKFRHHDLPAEPQVSRPSLVSTPVSVSSLVAKIVAAARDPRIVPFGAAGTAAELFPVRRLNRLLASAARDLGNVGIEYDVPPGCLPLRQQIARRSLEWGCALAAEDLITTSGAAEAVQLSLLAVARTGDTIAIESPAYYGTLQILEAFGMRALEIPSHPRDGMQLDALEAALKRHRVSAVLAVPNFSNPLGSLMPDENKEKLVALLAKREIPLIEDDVFGDLHFGPTRPRTAKSFDRKGLVLLCGSVSKTLAPGYRVGWVAPGRFRERVEVLKFSQSVATATLPQLAVAELLETGGYDRHLRGLRRNLAAQLQRVSLALREHFPPATRVTRPAGGSLLWVELPRRVDSLELHARAFAEGIGIAPGPIFSAKQRFRSFIRLNCGHPWSGRMEAALVTLGRLAAELA